MKYICVIPARYDSSRFPGKPLAMIHGHAMIEWVYTRANQVREFDEVIVATDDARIYDTVIDFGGKVEMTAIDLVSGTDRVATVAKKRNADVIINLQGDEPLIIPEVLQQLCVAFESPEVVMATPIRKIKNEQELVDPNNARVVIDHNKDALYFTRAVIPFDRNKISLQDGISKGIYFKHVGIYAYRKDFLLKLADLPVGHLEEIEKLEQLRVIENGYKIRTIETEYVSMSVDTEQDLNLVNNFIEQNKIKMDN
jgi:3-deoxy-manno-octulosonate cytidylyltransferase (CMP-KDO synthetase)